MKNIYDSMRAFMNNNEGIKIEEKAEPQIKFDANKEYKTLQDFSPNQQKIILNILYNNKIEYTQDIENYFVNSLYKIMIYIAQLCDKMKDTEEEKIEMFEKNIENLAGISVANYLTEVLLKKHLVVYANILKSTSDIKDDDLLEIYAAKGIMAQVSEIAENIVYQIYKKEELDDCMEDIGELDELMEKMILWKTTGK